MDNVVYWMPIPEIPNRNLIKYKHGELVNELAIEDSEAGRRFYLYADDGSFCHKASCEDIVSEWHEEINEEALEYNENDG